MPHAVLSTPCHAALQVEDCKLSSHAMRALTHMESARRLPAGQASLFDEGLLQPQFIQSFRSTLQAGLLCAVMMSVLSECLNGGLLAFLRKGHVRLDLVSHVSQCPQPACQGSHSSFRGLAQALQLIRCGASIWPWTWLVHVHGFCRCRCASPQPMSCRVAAGTCRLCHSMVSVFIRFACCVQSFAFFVVRRCKAAWMMAGRS